MRVFLKEPLESIEDVERKLESEILFVPLPEAGYRMMTMPKLVWEAHDYAVAGGLKSEDLTGWALKQSELTGYPLEFTYPSIVYFAAQKVREDEERRSEGDGGTSVPGHPPPIS